MENKNQLVTLLEGLIATIQKVDDLETQVALANANLRAMQETNNQLADIAFDENKFTQALMDKVEEVAREAAEDKVNDNNLLNSSEVESAIEDYLSDNDYVERSDVIDIVQEEVNQVIDERTENVARRIAKEVMEQTETRIINSILYIIDNKLTAKENDHANNDRDTSIQVSGTNGQGEARSYNAASA